MSDKHYRNPFTLNEPFTTKLGARQIQLFKGMYHHWTDTLQQHVRFNMSGDLASHDLYVGFAGMAYTFWKCGLLEKATDVITYSLNQIRSGNTKSFHGCGFLCSEYGVYALVAVLYQEHAKALTEAMLERIFEFEIGKDSSPEFLTGLAGFLYTIRFLESNLMGFEHAKKKLYDLKVDIFHHLINDISDATEHPWIWHHKHYIGAAHGEAGILFQLMECTDLLDDHSRNAIRVQLDRLMDVREADGGNYPSSLESESSKSLIQFCHGAPGVALTLMKGYELYGDNRYLQLAKELLDLTWDNGLLIKGIGLCHGISGNGYAFLNMYRLTNDAKYWMQAVSFAEFACQYEDLTSLNKMRKADHPFSLYEGICGGILLLDDILTYHGKEKTPGFPCYADL